MSSRVGVEVVAVVTVTSVVPFLAVTRPRVPLASLIRVTPTVISEKLTPGKSAATTVVVSLMSASKVAVVENTSEPPVPPPPPSNLVNLPVVGEVFALVRVGLRNNHSRDIIIVHCFA